MSITVPSVNHAAMQYFTVSEWPQLNKPNASNQWHLINCNHIAVKHKGGVNRKRCPTGGAETSESRFAAHSRSAKDINMFSSTYISRWRSPHPLKLWPFDLMTKLRVKYDSVRTKCPDDRDRRKTARMRATILVTMFSPRWPDLGAGSAGTGSFAFSWGKLHLFKLQASSLWHTVQYCIKNQ